VTSSLDDDKAIDPAVIDLGGKTTLADFMVVATGTSQRHIAAMAEKLIERLKATGHARVQAEGLGDSASSWILIDAGDVLVHLFRAETRAFYDIEKLWSVAPPRRAAAVATTS
jgi:ribosome-associated protein